MGTEKQKYISHRTSSRCLRGYDLNKGLRCFPNSLESGGPGVWVTSPPSLSATRKELDITDRDVLHSLSRRNGRALALELGSQLPAVACKCIEGEVPPGVRMTEKWVRESCWGFLERKK